MSEQTAQEPTMEEILASIRRIISEDDAPPAEAVAAPVQEEAVVMAAPAPAPAPPEPEEDDDVLELTETVEAASEFETVGDLDVYTPAKAAPEPAWEPEPEPEPVFVAAPEPAPAPAPRYTMGAASISGGMTIEELVRSILEPKLNEWADQNLPRIVEQIVRDKLSK
ncbi:MAG: DUF2497 domain-containing protein [Caulobacter sp.]|nr:DUF2497 domain-containing protein [Caulobacter sp.]